MPFLAVLSVVGAVVWLVLLPVKIICCPIGESGDNIVPATLTRTIEIFEVSYALLSRT